MVSALTRVEVPAALWRKVRIGDLTPADAADLVSAFEGDYQGSGDRAPRFGVLAATESVLDDAAGRTGSHRLRAYDAVQLASAVAARAADPCCTAFACFDRDLRAAAAAGGFELVP